VAKFPRLESYLQRIESLPKIKEYLASDRFKKFPINGPSAKWGNTASG
jgi:hypothetical protein